MTDISLDKLKKIINVNLTINDTYENLDVVLHKILHSIEFILDCEETSYMEYDTKHKDLVFRVVSNKKHTHSLIGLRIPHGQGIAHKVLQERKGIMINNMKDTAEHYEEIDKIISFNTKSILAFPLFNKDKSYLGVIEANNKRNEKDFTKEDYQIFALFCQQIEQSIRNAEYVSKLHNDLQEVKDITLFSTPFIFSSKEMKVKLNLAEKIAKSQAPILITGESGGGKRLLAQQIHKWANDFSGLLVEVLCEDIMRKTNGDDSKIHAFLFGENKKKSYKTILFREKERTVVFSEIWRLPLKTQNDILHYLKNKSVIYENKETMYVENMSRIIFTSSRNLEALVEDGKFSEELYFFINTLSINVPELHKRGDDIVAIAEYYFQRYIKEFQKDIKDISPDVYVILKKYGWPYSVRELMQVIYRAVLACEKEILTKDDLYFNSQKKIFSDNDDEENKKQEIVTLKEATNVFKKQYIYDALLQNNWNCTKTAKILEIQRSYLSRLVKELNLKNKKKRK